MSRASRTLAFLITAVPLGAAGATVILLGWLLVPLLAITPAVVPVLIGFRAAVGWLAGAEAGLARSLLGITVRPRTSTPSGRGFWGRGLDVLVDGAFAKQQGYLLLRFVLGGVLAILELSLVGAALGAIALPISYHWTNPDVTGWHVDTIGEALLYVPAGLVLLLLAWALLRPLRTLWVHLAYGLLDSRDTAAAAPDELRLRRRRALMVHAAVYAAFNGLFVLIWAVTSHGYFWPAWPLIALFWPLAVHAWVQLVEERPAIAAWGRTKALAIHFGVYVASVLFYLFLWLASGSGYFWAVWPILAFTLILVGHWIWTLRQGELERRIEVLETTRAGAVVQQEDERRRIERDLHDGAQARLVALGMSLGMAEQKLQADDPEAARGLLADAQRDAREALQELRDLARGIHPPVLTDRGLEAAVVTLADHNPLEIDVAVELDERPPAAVETAAYFVVAEALTNATKHAGATRVSISIHAENGAVVVDVEDDGEGGADASGAGLAGLARRVRALDGTLEVTSPAGGPTRLTAELPCAS